jgi:predicted glycogen debranching enzyme
VIAHASRFDGSPDGTGMTCITFGRHTTGTSDVAATHEWLVTDGLGGFAMGTVAGLRTRRYHGLLIVATEPPIGRHLGLAALDAVVTVGDRRIELATHEWATGSISPTGHVLLDRFDLIDGVPRWQWSAGPLVVQMELAMVRGRPGVATRWTVLSAPDPVSIELGALCTWRDVHGERRAAGDPRIALTADGFVFEDAYRVAGPGFRADGTWYRGVHHREEAARGLDPEEDLYHAGRFTALLRPGESIDVSAWAGALEEPPAPASEVIDRARDRARSAGIAAGAVDEPEALLAHAADQFVVTGATGPTVVAGYPWFGDWSRDTMTSYEGLFLETGRVDEGRELLIAAADTVSEGMLANTADAGGTEYNTADATMWFLRAIGRHVERTDDLDLGGRLLPTIHDIVRHHVEGTRFGIRVDGDGLITQGADGWALTWMDARVGGRPITQRSGKPVEINALWIDGLAAAARIARSVGADGHRFDALADRATEAFAHRFVTSGRGWLDVVDGEQGDQIRPNQVVAAAVLGTRATSEHRRAVLTATRSLHTSIGLRSLSPADAQFLGRHRGGPADRDAAYHQGTVWPWLLGPLVDLAMREGEGDRALRIVSDASPHLLEWGLGSVSETADGTPPHDATGCPFQAWSVAEWLRARRVATRGSASQRPANAHA